MRDVAAAAIASATKGDAATPGWSATRKASNPVFSALRARVDQATTSARPACNAKVIEGTPGRYRSPRRDCHGCPDIASANRGPLFMSAAIGEPKRGYTQVPFPAVV